MINMVFDVTGCAVRNPAASDLLAAMHETATLLGCNVLGTLPITFQPHGVTCVLVLAESHLTVSTWPEHALAHIDLFTCRAHIDPSAAIGPILNLLGGDVEAAQHVTRIGPAASAARPT